MRKRGVWPAAKAPADLNITLKTGLDEWGEKVETPIAEGNWRGFRVNDDGLDMRRALPRTGPTRRGNFVSHRNLYHTSAIRLLWVPPLLWMALIIWLSTGQFSDVNTGRVLRPLLLWIFPWADASDIYAAHFIVRKAAHICEYTVLAWLWFLALTRERLWPTPRAAWTAFLVATGWACVDELNQAMQPSRKGSIGDVGLDIAGAMVGSFAAWQDWRHGTAAVIVAAAFLVIASRLGFQTLWIPFAIFLVLLTLQWRRKRHRQSASEPPADSSR